MSPGPYPIELLTTSQMARADRLTIERGVPGIVLMENAATAIAKAATNILNKTSGRRVLVLCGPGNNGGDGYAAARLLRSHRIKVRVASLTPPEQLRGDAKEAASQWTGGIEAAADCDLRTVDLVIDAIFGAGLARDLDAPTVAIVERLNQWRRETGQKVIAVDIPSGVDGTTGRHSRRGGGSGRHCHVLSLEDRTSAVSGTPALRRIDLRSYRHQAVGARLHRSRHIRQ